MSMQLIPKNDCHMFTKKYIILHKDRTTLNEDVAKTPTAAFTTTVITANAGQNISGDCKPDYSKFDFHKPSASFWRSHTTTTQHVVGSTFDAIKSSTISLNYVTDWKRDKSTHKSDVNQAITAAQESVRRASQAEGSKKPPHGVVDDRLRGRRDADHKTVGSSRSLQSPPIHDRPRQQAASSGKREPIAITSTLDKNRKSRNSKAKGGAADSNESLQRECCLLDCHNTVTNRLRFSLRCHEIRDFKQPYLEMGWNKVCHYHYFSDLYKYKKMTQGSTNRPLPKSKKIKSAKKRRIDVDSDENEDENNDYEEESDAEDSPNSDIGSNDNSDITVQRKRATTLQSQNRRARYTESSDASSDAADSSPSESDNDLATPFGSARARGSSSSMTTPGTKLRVNAPLPSQSSILSANRGNSSNTIAVHRRAASRPHVPFTSRNTIVDDDDDDDADEHLTNRERKLPRPASSPSSR